jgi:hypothetical protein
VLIGLSRHFLKRKFAGQIRLPGASMASGDEGSARQRSNAATRRQIMAQHDAFGVPLLPKPAGMSTSREGF